MRVTLNLFLAAVSLACAGARAATPFSVDASVRRTGATCVLRVNDRGPGIDPAERERIFEPFHRPASAAETGTGWGLGLALVRQIATLHDGTVHCLDRPQGGCTFELVLPASDSPLSR